MPRFVTPHVLVLLVGLLAGCNSLPVSPLVNFRPYQNPVFPKENFEGMFAAWKAGQNASWEVHYKASGLATEEFVVSSAGTASLGPVVAGASNPRRSFTPTRAELQGLVDALLASNIFALYDGYYGAYAQASGTGGPEIRLVAGSLEKHVGKDNNLNTSLSWEANAIELAANALQSLALAHLK